MSTKIYSEIIGGFYNFIYKRGTGVINPLKFGRLALV